MGTSNLKMAVFIDFDNIEIGVKNTLGSRFDVGAVLEALKERGEVVSKTAYGDWKRAEDYSRSLTQHAVKMVQRNVTPGGDKNGADINLVVDALEMAFRLDHINAFVIVGGDSDFIALVEKLQQYDKKVFVVGGRAFTSTILQRNCHEFIAYENLGSTHSAGRRRGRPGRAASQAPVSQAVPLVRRAMKVLSEKDVAPQLGLLKSTLLQLDSTFSERNYGASTFRDFTEKLASAGLVTLTGTGRTIRVELKDSGRPREEATPARQQTQAKQPTGPASPVEPELAPTSDTRSASGPTPEPEPTSETPSPSATDTTAGTAAATDDASATTQAPEESGRPKARKTKRTRRRSTKKVSPDPAATPAKRAPRRPSRRRSAPPAE